MKFSPGTRTLVKNLTIYFRFKCRMRIQEIAGTLKISTRTVHKYLKHKRNIDYRHYNKKWNSSHSDSITQHIGKIINEINRLRNLGLRSEQINFFAVLENIH